MDDSPSVFPSPPLILVADDDPNMRRLLRLFLEKSQFSVLEAENGREVLQWITTSPPDLLLLDVNMLEMDGFQVCSLIKTMPGVAEIPILMITATQADDRSVERAFAAGAEDYIAKPIHWAVLRQRLRSIIARQRAFIALRESEERFRMVAQSAGDAIIVANGEGNITYCNRAAEEIFGFAEEEMIHRNVEQLMPLHFRAQHRAGMNRLNTTGHPTLIGQTLELEGERHDGTPFPLELSLGTWLTGSGRFFCAVIRDISGRKRKEQPPHP